MGIQITPSILNADFGRLAEAVGVLERGGADWVHVDVMDGHFVPNITIGPEVVKALNDILDRTNYEHEGEGGTYVVPGHGFLGDEHEVVEYREGGDTATVHKERKRSRFLGPCTRNVAFTVCFSLDVFARK